MLAKQPENSTQPSSNTFMFVLNVASLILLSMLIVTLPLTIPALIYVFRARKNQQHSDAILQASAKQLQQAHHEIERLQAELHESVEQNTRMREVLARIGAMEVWQREEESLRLDGEIAAKKSELSTLLGKHEEELAALRELHEAELHAIEREKESVKADISS